MIPLPYKETSFWRDSGPKTSFPAIKKDVSVDVIIIGVGITGLTTAYLLKQSGLKVAVLEKNTVGSGTTSGTTGKVTSQHNIIYVEIQKRFGDKFARIYAEANQTAIEKIERVIKQEKIACDWQRQDNFVYTVDPQKTKQFKQEADVASSFGLPANFEADSALPFKVAGAVKFSNQAQFNAQKYVIGLAKAVHGGGSYVFERSNVTNIRDGKPTRIKANNVTVIAKNIVVATKVPTSPLIARVSYAALEYPHTSYIVAGAYEGNVKGMYISPDDGQYSILPVQNGAKRLLLVGGENHIPGLRNPRARQQKLADFAEKKFGITTIAYHWKAMDYLAYDKVPLIGKLYPWSRHLYTATGFKKWGLSTSMVAATILHDSIVGQQNPWSKVFTSTRLRPVFSIPRIILGS